jgi:hypothetical protein
MKMRSKHHSPAILPGGKAPRAICIGRLFCPMNDLDPAEEKNCLPLSEILPRPPGRKPSTYWLGYPGSLNYNKVLIHKDVSMRTFLFPIVFPLLCMELPCFSISVHNVSSSRLLFGNLYFGVLAPYLGKDEVILVEYCVVSNAIPPFGKFGVNC